MDRYAAGNSRLAAAAALTVALVVAVLALAAPTSDAKKKRSCKTKSEKSGCTLKAGQVYSGAASGGPRVHLSIVTEKSGINIALRSGLQCVKGARERLVDFRHGSAAGKPKIGKTYAVNTTERNGSNSAGDITQTFTGKVKIVSAKKATADLTYTHKVGPTVDCNVKVSAPNMARG